MPFFDLGPEKILVVMVIALVVFGPERLPEMARKIGSAFRELRNVEGTVRTEMQRALDAPEPVAPPERDPFPEQQTFS